MEREDPRGSNEGLKVVAKRLFIGELSFTQVPRSKTFN
jgi:hypothetical protein